jgi:hypothetical protein
MPAAAIASDRVFSLGSSSLLVGLLGLRVPIRIRQAATVGELEVGRAERGLVALEAPEAAPAQSPAPSRPDFAPRGAREDVVQARIATAIRADDPPPAERFTAS